MRRAAATPLQESENIRHLAHAQALRSQAYFVYDMIVCLMGSLPFAPLWEENGFKERTSESSDLFRGIGSEARGEPGGPPERDLAPGRWRGEDGGGLA